MPNQVFGPYSPTSWVSGTTALNQPNMNNLETQASVALNGFNGDLFVAFVFSGMVCTKDGVTANQLDVTAGRAYTTMSDGTRGLIVTVASTALQFTTSTPSTTYYLFLLNTGAWQWSTTSTGPANSLAICQATTDASGNILVVTDKRSLGTSMFTGMAGTLFVSPSVASKPALWATLVSAPGGDTHVSAAGVAGDTVPRASLYVRSSDGFGGFTGGAGSSITAHLFAQSDGWHCAGTENITIGGNFVGAAATGLPTTRYNGTTGIATSVPIYTGYTGGANPSNPPTGSIRIDA